MNHIKALLKLLKIRNEPPIERVCVKSGQLEGLEGQVIGRADSADRIVLALGARSGVFLEIRACDVEPVACLAHTDPIGSYQTRICRPVAYKATNKPRR